MFGCLPTPTKILTSFCLVGVIQFFPLVLQSHALLSTSLIGYFHHFPLLALHSLFGVALLTIWVLRSIIFAFHFLSAICQWSFLVHSSILTLFGVFSLIISLLLTLSDHWLIAIRKESVKTKVCSSISANLSQALASSRISGKIKFLHFACSLSLVIICVNYLTCLKVLQYFLVIFLLPAISPAESQLFFPW